MPTPEPRPRWAAWALAAYLLAACALLLSPIGPGRILGALVAWVQHDLGVEDFRQGWLEVPANVVLFIPLGFLLALLLRRAWVAVLLSVTVSFVAELLQLQLSDRLSSVRDIAANAAGAVIGAAVAWMLMKRSRRLHGDRAGETNRSD
ncbi:VanZ family protein [Microbacterium sp. NPDC055312]